MDHDFTMDGTCDALLNSQAKEKQINAILRQVELNARIPKPQIPELNKSSEI